MIGLTPAVKKEIEGLHATYCRETGLDLPLSPHIEWGWLEWMRYGKQHGGKDGWGVNQLRQTIRYLKNDKTKAIGYFKFRWFIGYADYFAEDLAEARAAARRQRVDPGLAQALRATGRPAEPQEPRRTKPIAGLTAAVLAEIEKVQKEQK